MSKTANGKGRAPENWRIPEWFPKMEKEKKEKLYVYYGELKHFNNKINLVSPKTMDNADLIHFADSICACNLIVKNESFLTDIHDIGSGNGFPGLVMAILFPDLKITVVDRDKRKIEFIKHVAWKIKINNVSYLACPVEDLPRCSIETAISRGFAPLDKGLALTGNLFKKESRYFHLKGSQWREEVSQVLASAEGHPLWRSSLLGEYRRPLEETAFAVIKTVKIAD